MCGQYQQVIGSLVILEYAIVAYQIIFTELTACICTGMAVSCGI